MSNEIKFDKTLLNRIKHRLTQRRHLDTICNELKLNKDELIIWLYKKDGLTYYKQQLIDAFDIGK